MKAPLPGVIGVGPLRNIMFGLGNPSASQVINTVLALSKQERLG